MTDTEGPCYRWTMTCLGAVRDIVALASWPRRAAKPRVGALKAATAVKPFLLALCLSGCSPTAGVTYPEPIPGSITYGGQPRTKLAKAPVGSFFNHRFTDQFGNLVQETYVIQPDRSLLLMNRIVIVDDADSD